MYASQTSQAPNTTYSTNDTQLLYHYKTHERAPPNSSDPPGIPLNRDSTQTQGGNKPMTITTTTS